MIKEVTQANLGSIQYNQEPSEVSQMSDTINSRKILRIKKQFMKYVPLSWLYLVRGSLFILKHKIQEITFENAGTKIRIILQN